MRASELIDPAALQHLEAVVAEAERETGGEIVVAVVRACDEYGAVGWRLGVALAALVFLGLGWLVPPLPWTAYLAAQATALALGHGVARLEAVRRALLPPALVERRVAERARRCFAEEGLRRTRGRTGHSDLITSSKRLSAPLSTGETIPSIATVQRPKPNSKRAWPDAEQATLFGCSRSLRHDRLLSTFSHSEGNRRTGNSAFRRRRIGLGRFKRIRACCVAQVALPWVALLDAGHETTRSREKQ